MSVPAWCCCVVDTLHSTSREWVHLTLHWDGNVWQQYQGAADTRRAPSHGVSQAHAHTAKIHAPIVHAIHMISEGSGTCDTED